MQMRKKLVIQHSLDMGLFCGGLEHVINEHFLLWVVTEIHSSKSVLAQFRSSHFLWIFFSCLAFLALMQSQIVCMSSILHWKYNSFLMRCQVHLIWPFIFRPVQTNKAQVLQLPSAIHVNLGLGSGKLEGIKQNVEKWNIPLIDIENYKQIKKLQNNWKGV